MGCLHNAHALTRVAGAHGELQIGPLFRVRFCGGLQNAIRLTRNQTCSFRLHSDCRASSLGYGRGDPASCDELWHRPGEPYAVKALNRRGLVALPAGEGHAARSVSGCSPEGSKLTTGE